MKKEYTSPELVIASYSSEDVITASGLTKSGTQTSKNFGSIAYSDIKF